MRIEFLTQDDPLYILPLFETFVTQYLHECEIVHVSCCRTMGSRPRLKLLRELSNLYTGSGFLRLTVRTAVSRLLALRRLKQGAARFHSLRQLCRAYGISCSGVDNPNSDSFIESVRKRNADLIVSVACPYILKQKLLDVPPRGCINIHHAPLPRYKGMMPTFWQMYHGENAVGLTIHYMSARVDEGAALLQDELRIEKGETLDNLIRRSKRHAADCLRTVLKRIAADSVEVKPLDDTKGTYFTFPTLKEIREFQRRGFRAI